MSDNSDYQIPGEKTPEIQILQARVRRLEDSLRHAVDYINLVGEVLNVVLDETYGVNWEDSPDALKAAFDKYYGE